MSGSPERRKRFLMAGVILLGWAALADGATASPPSADHGTMVKAAEGKAAESRKVRYHIGYGQDRVFEQIFGSGKDQRLLLLDSELKWTRAGYTFLGWATDIATDTTPLGPLKCRMMADLPIEDSVENYLIPFLKYHTRWKSLGKADFCGQALSGPLNILAMRCMRLAVPMTSSPLRWRPSSRRHWALPILRISTVSSRWRPSIMWNWSS